MEEMFSWYILRNAVWQASYCASSTPTIGRGRYRQAHLRACRHIWRWYETGERYAG
jgi:hypothetical protein